MVLRSDLNFHKRDKRMASKLFQGTSCFHRILPYPCVGTELLLELEAFQWRSISSVEYLVLSNEQPTAGKFDDNTNLAQFKINSFCIIIYYIFMWFSLNSSHHIISLNVFLTKILILFQVSLNCVMIVQRMKSAM